MLPGPQEALEARIRRELYAGLASAFLPPRARALSAAPPVTGEAAASARTPSAASAGRAQWYLSEGCSDSDRDSGRDSGRDSDRDSDRDLDR